MQSRKRSLLETVSTTAVSVAYAIPVNHAFMTSVSMDAWTKSVVVTGVFVVMSVCTKYAARRFFNWLDHRRLFTSSS